MYRVKSCTLSNTCGMYILLFCSLSDNKDFSQLSRELANHTAQRDQLLTRYLNLTEERDQLQTRYLNLTDERDQLQTSFKNAELELNKMKRKIGKTLSYTAGLCRS